MFKLVFDEKTNILLIEINAELSSEEFLKYELHNIHKGIDEIDIKRNMNRLFDCKKLIIHDSDINMSETFGEITNQYNKKYTNIKIAIVALSDVTFGNFRAHEVYGELPNIERQVFRSVKKAKEWLLNFV